MSDDVKGVPWPGFVDILSTVIIVFIFFMMITSVIIFMLAQNVKAKAYAEAKAQVESELSAAADTTTSEVEAQNASLRTELAQIKSSLSKSMLQDTIISPDGTSAFIIFRDPGSTLTDETVKKISDSVKNINDAVKIKKITITSNNTIAGGTGSFSWLRETALNRALNSRNLFLELQQDPGLIELKISEEAPEIESTHGYVKIQISY